ncbi:hypothetical protein KTE52_10540 [Burkholderia multivorans]|uniref:Uncharacterized protein n=1 Tax=Burkholderia multivorans TaxID=87883 RepID=A0AAP2HIH2_9BURK|nr:hypothetical protein [Burkholderia multivorans]MBU9363204.1 hypothetical protein [Burkholderia multivorans]MBU9597371.1 hypothetical protein [Burkholderia multivorans]
MLDQQGGRAGWGGLRRACAGVLLEVHAFSASVYPRPLAGALTKPFERCVAARSGACVRSNALARLPGVLAVFGVRRRPSADAHGWRIADARAAHNARRRIPGFTVAIWYAAQRPRGGPHPRAAGRAGKASTAGHARRIIFAIARVFAAGTFLQCLHGARFNFADGYVAT